MTRPRCRPRLVLCAVALALLAGVASPARAADSKEERRRRVEEAARVGSYPARDFTEAFVYQSKNYIVRTNTSKEVAFYVGELMDFAQKHYRRIFRYTGEMPTLAIHAYRTDSEYQRVAVKAGLPGSNGFFSRQGGESTIHVAYTDTYGETQPTKTLLHEGTHQFVSIVMDYRIPETFRHRFVDGMETLPSVPLWLNEGLATYMECSYYDGNILVVGEVNRPRLLELQHELRSNQHVPLETLFRTHSPRAFGPAHYAAAWGVVYWFRHGKDPRERALKRRILTDYLAACRRGFFEKPEADLEPFLTDDFQDRWRRHIAARSFEAFTHMTVGPNGSFAKWEAVWKKWILSLDPNDPHGGLGDQKADD
ncbi:MAG: hypothetical protein ACOCX4_04720 [Planctomycetota bacterium]